MTRIAQAKVTMPAQGCAPERAERLSRLIFYHLEGILTEDCRRLGAARAVTHLEVPPLEVDWNQTDDDTIARQGAAWIYRWLGTAE